MKRSPLKRSGELRRSSSLRQTHGLRPGKAPRPVSDRKAAERRAAYPARKQYLEDHPYCEIGYALSVSDDSKAQQWYRGNCRGKPDACHERQKQSAGGSLVDPVNLMAACNPCNDWVEDEPKIARDLGLVVWSNESPAEVYVIRMRQ